MESDTKVLTEQKPRDELELAVGTLSGSVVLSSGNGERETVL